MSYSGRKTILLIEDDADLRELYLELIVDHFPEIFDVYVYSNANKAYSDLLEARRIDLIITDFRLPGGHDGLTMIGNLRRKLSLPSLPAILITGYPSFMNARSNELTHTTVFTKPVSAEALSNSIKRILLEESEGGREMAPQGTPVIAA